MLLADQYGGCVEREPNPELDSVCQPFNTDNACLSPGIFSDMVSVWRYDVSRHLFFAFFCCSLLNFVFAVTVDYPGTIVLQQMVYLSGKIN